MKGNMLGERLKRLRMQEGVTQKVFADALHVSSSAVSKWENGQNVPDMEMMLKIAGYYNISMEELLEGELKKAEGSGEKPESKKPESREPDAKKEPVHKDDRKKWLGVGIAIGCVITAILMTAGTLIWKMWREDNDADFSYKIVAERHAKDAYWGDVYEVSVFYSGELTDERREEIVSSIREQWENSDLIELNIKTIKLLYNADREAAECFETNADTGVYFMFPHDMLH